VHYPLYSNGKMPHYPSANIMISKKMVSLFHSHPSLDSTREGIVDTTLQRQEKRQEIHSKDGQDIGMSITSHPRLVIIIPFASPPLFVYICSVCTLDSRGRAWLRYTKMKKNTFSWNISLECIW
jgi:hypothetical protein